MTLRAVLSPLPSRTVTLLVDWSVLWHIRSLCVLIPGRTAVSGASVGGSALLCTIKWERAFLGMPLSDLNAPSTCFWGHIYLWITILCKYFACSKLHCPKPWLPLLLCHPRRQLPVFFSLLFSAPIFPLPLYLSRLQFNVSISLIPLFRLPVPLSLGMQSFFLSVFFLPLPLDALTGIWGVQFCAREPFPRLRYPRF